MGPTAGTDFWRKEKSLAFTGIRTPDPSFRRQFVTPPTISLISLDS